jgi:hypothetical protein
LSTNPLKLLNDQGDAVDVPPVEINAFPLFETGSFGSFAGVDATSTGSGAPGQAGTTAIGSDTITHGGSGLVFVNSYGAGVTAAFHNVIIAAETYLESHFTNSITIHASFDLQALNHAFSGQNSFSTVGVSYMNLVNALQSHATSPDDTAAVNALKGTADPSGGQLFSVSNAEAKLLGLAGTTNGTDDSVILNNFYWNDTSIQSNPDDAIAVLMHELTEGAMGRIGGLWAPMDLFRYTATGQHDYTGGQDGKLTYFSPNGANVNTGLQYHNPINSSGQDDGFDWADWDQVGADANAHDPFGPGGPGAGDPGVLSQTDLRIMDVLGWTRAAAPKEDLNGDIASDVVGWNASTGAWGYWSVNGGTNTFKSLGAASTAYSLVGTGDFNGDFAQDAVWRNNSTGAWGWSDVSNGMTWHDMGGSSTAYNIVGIGDINGDGYSDVVWRNNSTGDWGWSDLHNGTAWHGVGGSSTIYSVVGNADINGDGFADALWRNNSTGAWGWTDFHNNNAWNDLGVSSSSYAIVGTGDFNGDGFADVLWSNNSTGDVGWTDIHNSNAWHDLGVNTTSSAVGVADFNGDGFADVAWQNGTTGAISWSDVHNGNTMHSVVASTSFKVV